MAVYDDIFKIKYVFVLYNCHDLLFKSPRVDFVGQTGEKLKRAPTTHSNDPSNRNYVNVRDTQCYHDDHIECMYIQCTNIHCFI